ncbi:hypothetical protein BpHYR1_005188 [Brachionus plicatilis]|uniref:Uncharacterized protein n=1 Tax=Brachionus plicatilis TaxID=10195 RepID=A0A3M7SUH8_BRAPC|nr:hypothetical protein BpHYR1_005188 [Brachionus plicatilis]
MALVDLLKYLVFIVVGNFWPLVLFGTFWSLEVVGDWTLANNQQNQFTKPKNNCLDKRLVETICKVYTLIQEEEERKRKGRGKGRGRGRGKEEVRKRKGRSEEEERKRKGRGKE